MPKKSLGLTWPPPYLPPPPNVPFKIHYADLAPLLLKLNNAVVLSTCVIGP